MPKGIYARPSEEERFWSKVDVKEENDCWEWLGSFDKDGYGWFSFQSITANKADKSQSGKTIYAHRYSALLKFKDLNDKLVRHTCDNPKCVNQNHLILGTPQDNMNDMVERNRALTGEKNYCSTLTNDQAKEILKKYEDDINNGKTYGSLKRLSDHYKVSKQIIYRITSKQTYKNIV